ncbi:Tat pathway signal protein [Pelagibius sp. Alg239-R121]|uniref:Tat pathway signal protein n=1 Tax=Pelagibius sp. Alg239-R121 TaxID=2993448 RepID=UPI0024A75C3E|nr:Tat pathway signal protein [Pelagibius sp. Alg239-R121]
MSERTPSTTLTAKSLFPALLPIGTLLLALGISPAVRSQDAADRPSGVKIELNKLEASDNACRAYLLFENRSASSFESLKLDLVLFDGEGVVAKRLAVEGAPLPREKTSLKVFEIARLPCERISRMLLNKLTSCSDDTGARSDCLEMVSTTTRGEVPFIK